MEKTFGKILIFVLFPFLLVGSIPVWLGVLSHKLFWGIIGALLAYSVVGIAFFVGGGAHSLLENKRRMEEKQRLETTAKKIIAVQSQNFPFFPTKDISKLIKPSPSITKSRHKHIYLKIREDHQKGLEAKELIIKHKLKIKEDTVRAIIQEGERGEFENL
jgi:hypothetical protein